MSNGSNRTTWIAIAAVAVVVVLAGAMALALGSDDGEQMLTVGPAGGGETDVRAVDAIPFGEVQVTGEALPPAAGGSDAAIGSPAPELRGTDFARQDLAITADGRPKVITFLAHWCGHCRAEVPRIVDHIAEFGMPQQVDLYAVATSTNSGQANYPPAVWLSREGWPIDTLVDDEATTAGTAFGLTGFPYFVAVDAEGNVVQRASGEISMEQFDALIAAAAAGGGVTVPAS